MNRSKFSSLRLLLRWHRINPAKLSDLSTAIDDEIVSYICTLWYFEFMRRYSLSVSTILIVQCYYHCQNSLGFPWMKRNRLILLYLTLCIARVKRIDFIHLLKFSALFLWYNYVYLPSWLQSTVISILDD